MKKRLMIYLQSLLIFIVISNSDKVSAEAGIDMITFTPALLESLKSNSFTAAVHDHHGPDFSRAVIDIESQLGDGSAQISIRDGSSYRYSLHGVDTGGVKPHFQGVSFLRDITLDGALYRRAVLSYNYGSGLSFSSGIIAPDEIEFTEPEGEGVLKFLDHRVYLDIMKEASMGNHEHPGGLQAHGDLIAIAMENPVSPGEPAAVYFIEMDNLVPRFVTALKLGSGGAPAGLNVVSAAASGFVKLENGFLVAVSGAKHGTAGTWFYKTSDHRIRPTTEWYFVDFWTPDRLPHGVCDIEGGEHDLQCYVGAGGGLSLLANHTGEIYMIATTGTSESGIDDEYVQLFRMNLSKTDTGSSSIELMPIWSDKRIVGRYSNLQYSMRWSGAAHVTNSGNLMLLNSERGMRRRGSRDTSDGMIYLNPSR